MLKKHLTFTRFELKLLRFVLISKPNILGRFKQNSITIYERCLFIRPEYLGFSFMVCDGKDFVPITITSFQVGDRFGDYGFGSTRALINNEKKKKIKKKAKKEPELEIFEEWDI